MDVHIAATNLPVHRCSLCGKIQVCPHCCPIINRTTTSGYDTHVGIGCVEGFDLKALFYPLEQQSHLQVELFMVVLLDNILLIIRL